jgi:peptidylprolyl isomerase
MLSGSKFLRILGVLLALVLLAAACGDDDSDGGVATEEGAEAESDTSEDADAEANTDAVEEPEILEEPAIDPADIDNTDTTTKPTVLVPDRDAPDELVITDIVEGEGTAIGEGDFAIMQYVGITYSTGEQFDASWDRGSSFNFVIGEGNVIEGWDEGIPGMMPGGRRELIIPPDMAYGEAGSGSGAIGPDETLIFTVDLIGFIPADRTQPEVTVPDAPATELGITDIIFGEGLVIEEGSTAVVHYVGVSQASGEIFDASWGRGLDQFIGLIVGEGQVIEGWDQGLIGMAVGGQRELVIPADLAYGEAGAGDGVIAPNDTIVFVIDLIAVIPPPEELPVLDTAEIDPEDAEAETEPDVESEPETEPEETE